MNRELRILSKLLFMWSSISSIKWVVDITCIFLLIFDTDIVIFCRILSGRTDQAISWKEVVVSWQYISTPISRRQVSGYHYQERKKILIEERITACVFRKSYANCANINWNLFLILLRSIRAEYYLARLNIASINLSWLLPDVHSCNIPTESKGRGSRSHVPEKLVVLVTLIRVYLIRMRTYCTGT